MTTGATAACTVGPRLQAALLAVSEVTPELLFGEPEAGFGAELDDELQLVDDLGFDSVMLMEFLHRLQEHFPALGELSLPETLPHLRTVGSVTEFLRRRLPRAEAV
ncbi:hypothetical protein CFP65_4137 [Kitasatospora sp. MMS16-BH015]|uniref:acyl carrier protein n=1 Tax=Kitasatospora sp. MMS16-BH015 TaxID=2018025 RepID=UPI000CA093AB|nr:phosphopantetheine-binding protein [Kitasatospora sp. MMS16-BH015]AUG78892.1 hypothetical protein CFP65_4137 [Kitasatospora sp. MMS16-BH015]